MPGRPGFREWVDRKSQPPWGLMPLTHITKGLVAEDILRAGRIEPRHCGVSGTAAFFFYGRPAYRIGSESVVKLEAACPYCFIFDEDLIQRAKEIFAFDTGAFEKRMYSHILIEEMHVEDFSLERVVVRPNKLIQATFGSQADYFNGDISKIPDPETLSEAWDLEGRAYLELLTARGRNEPDDRICSIEVVFGDPVPLESDLRAVVVPHTHWNDEKKSPWLETLHGMGVEVAPYLFIPGRHPEHYHALLEAVVLDLFRRWGVLP